MGSRDAIADWKAFDANNIPTKGIKLPPLFDEALQTTAAAAASDNDNALSTLRILELGCGCGELAHRLAREGHRVVGVDANEGAIALAKQRRDASADNGGGATFLAGDVTTFTENNDDGSTDRIAEFDFCILQLLLSVVGDATKRARTLSAAHDSLKSGGRVYLSCSGVSDGINPNYRRLYEEDFPATGEAHTYLSRDADGNVLYSTHHFSASELEGLMEGAGFVDVVVREVREASSRRPEEAANFLYAVARKP